MGELENKKTYAKPFSIIATGEKTSDDVVWFENYEQGGMSDGKVSLEW